MNNLENFSPKVEPIDKKMNEKNPTPEEQLEKEKRKVERLIEILRENGINVEEEKIIEK